MFKNLIMLLAAAGIVGISLCTISEAADIHVDIRPIGLSEQVARALTDTALHSPAALKELQGARYRVLRSEFGETFTLHVYDYTHNRLLALRADSRRAASVRVQDESVYRPSPSPEELKEAIGLLGKDPYFGPGVSARDLQPYQSMPGVVHESPDPSTWGQEGRIIAVGLIPTAASSHYHHEIVGVNLSKQSIVRYPAGAPATALAADLMCGPFPSGDWTTAQGTPGSAQVLIRDGDTVLWSMTVIRPSASSGLWGSGLELKDVYYKGKRVLSRAGVPIFNVKYSYNVCGPFRDWSWQEHPYWADGRLVEDGILQASGKPTTVFDVDDDSGDFRGVSIYTDHDATTMVSEMEAGWYRYLSKWTFYPDGTIEPRWGFGAVQDSCTCNLHKHHIYWRFDFDIGPTVNNRVEVYDGAQWHPIQTETKQYRDGSHQFWRVTDPKTGSGYVVIPGEQDQSAAADPYGKGDIWVLRAGPNELDDSYNYIDTSANIDAFLDDEDVDNQDIIFWYGGHFVHDAAHEGGNEHHILGPTLKPINW